MSSDRDEWGVRGGRCDATSHRAAEAYGARRRRHGCRHGVRGADHLFTRARVTTCVIRSAEQVLLSPAARLTRHSLDVTKPDNMVRREVEPGRDGRKWFAVFDRRRLSGSAGGRPTHKLLVGRRTLFAAASPTGPTNVGAVFGARGVLTILPSAVVFQPWDIRYPLA